MTVMIDIICPDCGTKGRRLCLAEDWHEWMNYCPRHSGDYR